MDKLILNGNCIAIRMLCKPISQDCAPNIRTEIIFPSIKFGHENRGY